MNSFHSLSIYLLHAHVFVHNGLICCWHHDRSVDDPGSFHFMEEQLLDDVSVSLSIVCDKWLLATCGGRSGYLMARLLNADDQRWGGRTKGTRGVMGNRLVNMFVGKVVQICDLSGALSRINIDSLLSREQFSLQSFHGARCVRFDLLGYCDFEKRWKMIPFLEFISEFFVTCWINFPRELWLIVRELEVILELKTEKETIAVYVK